MWINTGDKLLNIVEAWIHESQVLVATAAMGEEDCITLPLPRVDSVSITAPELLNIIRNAIVMDLRMLDLSNLTDYFTRLETHERIEDSFKPGGFFGPKEY